MRRDCPICGSPRLSRSGRKQPDGSTRIIREQCNDCRWSLDYRETKKGETS